MPTKNFWTPHQVDLLKRMVENKVPCKDIAERVGHPLSSCRTMMSELRALESGKQPKYIKRVFTTNLRVEQPKPPVPQRLQFREAARTSSVAPQSTSTFRFVMDAELRARIEGRGVTAGLLGDPTPGRSALDRMRAGVVAPPPLLDGHAVPFVPQRAAPWVTLPEGPAR